MQPAPSKQYPATGRAWPQTNVARSSNCQQGARYLPIVRYEGLFYQRGPERHCGTFYYFEPQSTNYLNLGNVGTFGSKVDAAISLEGYGSLPYFFNDNGFFDSISIRALLVFVNTYLSQIGDFTEDDLRNYNVNNDVLQYLLNNSDIYVPLLQQAEGFLLNTMLNPSSVEINQITLGNGDKMDRLYNIGNNYAGAEASEFFTYLDQPLCDLARQNGYDTLLFQREPGTKVCQTEILDTRPRQQSYNRICQQQFEFIGGSISYPTIWFSDYGFMTYQ